MERPGGVERSQRTEQSAPAHLDNISKNGVPQITDSFESTPEIGAPLLPDEHAVDLAKLVTPQEPDNSPNTDHLRKYFLATNDNDRSAALNSIAKGGSIGMLE
ncbi:hypothetical protein JYT19_00805, partial [Sulfobacillus acidophilus]|nr:hypothetical protein [Sulfobacillus acidophilus]